MMIVIQKNTNGDTRVATHVPTIEEFSQSNQQHAEDVYKLMRVVADDLVNRGKSHDWTKQFEPHKSEFYQAMVQTLTSDIDFMDTIWAKKHYVMERHHLNRKEPLTVDLIDVIEMICDCVAAGLARSGKVREVNINPHILERAVKNTVNRLVGVCEVREGETK